MELIEDPEVDGLISTIGGNNSSSLISFLDFEKIRLKRKVICGFSDVTSLHLAILKYAGLRTIYGPSVMCWFGDWKTIPRQWNQNAGWRVLNPGSVQAPILAANFDCSHCVSMISIPQLSPIELKARNNFDVSFQFMGGAVG